MYFHSLQFLFFLTATFALYWAVHRHKWARLGVLMAASSLPLERCCLIDEHDGNVVAHGITQATRGTEERRFRCAIFQVTLALRADKDGEQLRGQGHET